MNFTQPQDFQYVQGANIDGAHPYGDLNRIEIDNDIIPVRNTEDKRKLRGIDIAFLMEAVEERARFVGLDPMEEKFEFSRCISLAQINEIISRYTEIRNYVEEIEGETPQHLIRGIDGEALEYGDVVYDQITGTWEGGKPFSDFVRHLPDIDELNTDEIEIVSSKVLEIYSAISILDRLYVSYANQNAFSNKTVNLYTDRGSDPFYINTLRDFVSGALNNHNNHAFASASNYGGLVHGLISADSAITIDDNFVEFSKEGCAHNFCIYQYSHVHTTSHTIKQKAIYYIDAISNDEIAFDAQKAIQRCNEYANRYGYYDSSAPNSQNAFVSIDPMLYLELKDRTRWDVEENAE